MKIYLSKSNRSNPEEVMWIRHYIKNHYDQAEILEHTGGIYLVSKILSADVVFVCTENPPVQTDKGLVANVGRGLYSEVSNFLLEKDEGKDIVLCKFHEDQSFDLHKIIGAHTTNIDNWINYGKIVAELEPITLIDF